MNSSADLRSIFEQSNDFYNACYGTDLIPIRKEKEHDRNGRMPLAGGRCLFAGQVGKGRVRPEIRSH